MLQMCEKEKDNRLTASASFIRDEATQSTGPKSVGIKTKF